MEIDETYYGGTRKLKYELNPSGKKKTGRPAPGDKKKTPIVGVVQRNGRVVAKACPDVKNATLLKLIRKHVVPESTIYTDEFRGYGGIKTIMTKDGQPAGYRHRRIRHSSKVYVKGDIHTNSVEGFWSLLKRGIDGTYYAVSQKYLQSYLTNTRFGTIGGTRGI